MSVLPVLLLQQIMAAQQGGFDKLRGGIAGGDLQLP